MRYPIALAAFVSLLACGGGRRHAAIAPTPERLVLDSGTRVRVRPAGKPAVEGYLLVPYAPENDSLRMCADVEGRLCSDSTGPGVRRFAVRELEGVALRGRQTGNYGLLGLYTGALSGAVLAHDRTTDTGDFMVLGLVVGAVVGGFIGNHVDGWIPLFPCGPHGQCAWPRGVSLPSRGAR
jgi:hypothetical protein